MDTLTTKRIALMLFNILVVTTAQMCLKHGMTTSGADLAGGIGHKFVTLITVIFTRPFVFAGFSLFAFSSMMWLVILKNVPLSLAYPTVALSYVLTTFLSWWKFKEQPNALSLSGLFFICCGVILVGIGLTRASAK